MEQIYVYKKLFEAQLVEEGHIREGLKKSGKFHLGGGGSAGVYFQFFMLQMA